MNDSSPPTLNDAAAPAGPWLTSSRWGRRVLFGSLYFSEGAPIGFIWWFLPTMLRSQGVGIDNITLITAIVAWPWILKFAWAPLIDAFFRPKLGFRGCVIVTQVLMAITLLPLIRLGLATEALPLAIGLLVLHAICAATQDVSIDAWAIAVTPEDERGKISGFMQAGMLGGRWLFGAGALIVAGMIDDRLVVWLLVLAVLLSMLLVFFGTREQQNDLTSRDRQGAVSTGKTEQAEMSREPPGYARGSMRTPSTPWNQFVAALRDALILPTTWLAAAFALLGGVAFETYGAVLGPFLVDRGLAPGEIGFVHSINVVMLLVGSLIGGVLVDRFGRKRIVGGALVLLALTVGGAGGFEIASENEGQIRLAFTFTIYLLIGLFTAASYALFMDCTDKRLGATQFSAYMGLTNACESGSAFLAGKIIAGSGYGVAFAVAAVVSVVALVPLWMMHRRKITADSLSSVA